MDKVTPDPNVTEGKSKLPKSDAPSSSSKSAPIPPALYLVATPIGNLEDITLRALRILHNVDVIACEDTRTSHVLLAHYGIKTPCISYHEHNAAAMRPKILARICAGQSVALISDAGTPLISDPGYKLVNHCATEKIPVVPIPGACSVITALCASGLPTDQFLFLGFLPNKTKARKAMLSHYKTTKATLVCFESPNRLNAALADIKEIFGESHLVTVARELTKRFEELRHASVSDLIEHYAATGAPRGEIVILIAPSKQTIARKDETDALLIHALKTLSVKEAAALVASSTNHPKRELYQRALVLKNAGAVS